MTATHLAAKLNCRRVLLATACIILAAPTAYAQTIAPAASSQTDPNPPPIAAPLILDYEVPARANFTKAAFRFWYPAGNSANQAQPIRAVLLLVPGYNDDGRKNLRDPLWQDFARRNRLVLVACFFQGDYADAPSGSGDALQEALAGFARQSSHPEVASVPLLLYGASAGGQFNYNYVIWRPARVVAFIVNKGGFYNDQPPGPQAYAVPGLFFLGLKDQPFRIEAITRIWTDGRAKGALWALAPQPESAHEFSLTPGVARIFFQAVLDVRLPAAPIPTNPSAMQPMLERQGWIGDLTTHEIHPASQDALPNLQASWLPNETFAAAWKEFVVSGVPLASTSAAPPTQTAK
jgi:dienelactone hydrolase